MKGLILEGGAMRGMFTAGVIDVMMEHGVQYDGAIGVSAGAAFGCNYKSGQIGRVIRYNTAFCRDARYAGLRSLLRTGSLYSPDFCYHTVPREYDIFDCAAYDANPMAFYLVTTDLVRGQPIYHRCDRAGDEMYEWIRASSSLPLVSRPVVIGGCPMLDGGMTDSIPLRYFESIGYTRNVLILTRPRGYRKQRTEHLWLLRRALRRYPLAYAAMVQRHEVYNRTLEEIEEKEKKQEILVIRPAEPLQVGAREKDPARLRAVYALGRQMGEEMLPAVQTFLAEGEGEA